MYFKAWIVGNGGCESTPEYYWIDPEWTDITDDEEMFYFFEEQMSPMPASIRRICWDAVEEFTDEEIEKLIESNKCVIADREARIKYLLSARKKN